MKKFGDILGIVLSIVGLPGLWFSYQAFRHDAGGELTAWHHQQELYNNSDRTIFVCLDDIDADLTSLQVTPFFDNSSKYSIKDFSLTYTLESNNVSCEHTGFYSRADYNDTKSVFRYNYESLKPYTCTEPPFSNFRITSRQSRCMIETKATYDGAKHPYLYNLDIWFLVIDRNNISEENWKLSCKKAIFDIVQDKEYDIYYYSSNNKDYVFDVNLSNVIAEESRKAVSQNLVKPEDATTAPIIYQPSEVMPFAMREVEITSFEFFKGNDGEESVLRINYQPSDVGAYAIFAWFYKTHSHSSYLSKLEYLAPESASVDIVLRGDIKTVCKVAQALYDPSLKPIKSEEDKKNPGFLILRNPNRVPVCVYAYNAERNQVWHTTIHKRFKRRVLSTDLRSPGNSNCPYEVFQMPIRPMSAFLSYFWAILLLLCTVGTWWFVIDQKDDPLSSGFLIAFGVFVTAVFIILLFILF